MKKLTALILVLACALMLFSACGSSEDDVVIDDNGEDDVVIGDSGDSWEEGGNTLTLATEDYEVAGVWSINDRYLYIDPDGGYYIYATPEGRMGMGEYDNSNGAPAIIFNDYYYDLAIREDGALVPIQNGEGYDDEESLDRITFFPDGADSLAMWNLSDLDGTWVDEYGEYIEIDSTAMQYSASSETTAAGGTIADDYNGKGTFLSLNGYGYICPLPDMSGFTLQFVAGTYSEPDGSFEGTFYPDSGDWESTDDWENTDDWNTSVELSADYIDSWYDFGDLNGTNVDIYDDYTYGIWADYSDGSVSSGVVEVYEYYLNLIDDEGNLAADAWLEDDGTLTVNIYNEDLVNNGVSQTMTMYRYSESEDW